MNSKHFNPERDLAPMPFDERICRQALELKENGLTWQPHVGCFVWDPDQWIKVTSPFPDRIYFVLSLARFVEIFDSIEQISKKLVWLPIWNQAQIVCRQLGIADQVFEMRQQLDRRATPTDELLQLYELINDALRQGSIIVE
jgi:hypothetical protein